MKPTPADLAFYRRKTTPVWAAGVTKADTVTIDGVINAHAGIKSDFLDKHFDKHNLLVLLQMRRRRGAVMSYELESLAQSAECLRAAQRKAIARRWLRKIKARRTSLKLSGFMVYPEILD